MNSKKILSLSNDELALVIGGTYPSAKDKLKFFGAGFAAGALVGPVGVAVGAGTYAYSDKIASYKLPIGNNLYIGLDRSFLKSTAAGAVAGGSASTALMVVGAATVARSLYRKLKSK